ncbi:hypothetical protein J6590_033701 [Homalodisca vitripennis]|nr:hypothetical protein J6590_033701 [Homalodisca vitripennis]
MKRRQHGVISKGQGDSLQRPHAGLLRDTVTRTVLVNTETYSCTIRCVTLRYKSVDVNPWVRDDSLQRPHAGLLRDTVTRTVLVNTATYSCTIRCVTLWLLQIQTVYRDRMPASSETRSPALYSLIQKPIAYNSLCDVVVAADTKSRAICELGLKESEDGKLYTGDGGRHTTPLRPVLCRHSLAITLIAGEQDLQPAYNSECNYSALIMAAIHISLDNEVQQMRSRGARHRWTSRNRSPLIPCSRGAQVYSASTILKQIETT